MFSWLKEGVRRPSFFYNKLKSKKMNEIELKNTEKLEINRIKKTPFQYVKDGEKNYITCGKVVLETTKTIEEMEKKLSKIPWEEMALLCQAITNEMLNEKLNEKK